MKKCSKLLLERSGPPVWTTGGHNLLGADLTHPSQVIRPSGARLPQCQVREMQIKTQWDINKMKWQNLTRIGQGFGEQRTLTTRYWGGCTVIHYGTLYGGLFSKQFKADPLNEPAIPCISKGNEISRYKRCCMCLSHHRSQQPNSHYVCQWASQNYEIYWSHVLLFSHKKQIQPSRQSVRSWKLLL